MKYFLLLLTSLILVACDNAVKTETTAAKTEEVAAPVVEGSAEISLDVPGAYKGVIPCADCEGIETTLTLKDDNTYTLSQVYLGKEDAEVFTTEGKYTVQENALELEIEDMPKLYKVVENAIIQLDMEGNVIDGEFADMYVLKKDLNTEEKAPTEAEAESDAAAE